MTTARPIYDTCDHPKITSRNFRNARPSMTIIKGSADVAPARRIMLTSVSTCITITTSTNTSTNINNIAQARIKRS